jgi:1-acyl-sn-glycerol-3-phosphate acyltransferase
VVWPFVGVLVTGLMVPVIIAGAFMVVVDRRARLFRASCLAVVLMWVDIRMLLACWALYAKSPDHSSPTWREDHEKVFSQALDSLMYYARRWVGLEVVLEGRMHFGSDDEPLLALARHAGPADSLAIAWLLSRTAGRLPRIVLAEALRWDPGIDTILSRLESFFMPAQSRPGEDRAAGLSEMAATMADGDVFVIFPEGQNWTPTRRDGLIQRMRERGDHTLARRAEELRNVLPPRVKGAWAARSARPGADVMVLAHVGLARLSSPRMIWDALPFHDRPFVVRTWTYAADTVPTDPVAFEAWLNDRWTEVDLWVEERAHPYLPGHEPAPVDPLRDRSGAAGPQP